MHQSSTPATSESPTSQSHPCESPNCTVDTSPLRDSTSQNAGLRVFKDIPESRPHTPLLNRIDSPADLKPLNTKELLTLADELREFLLYSAGQSGGHFGANLGVVELTIALHYLLDTPHDKLVWDVGHQAYAHKVLTGRRERLMSIRSKSGLTAFPERQESEYDTFGVGHSSTSISAGLGMSLALRHLKSDAKVACVIGDGAMTGGMAFEAMNDAVQQHADLLVVLNDNDMSISCSIGGFSRHLAMLWELGYQVDINANGQPKLTQRPDMPMANRRARHSEHRDIPKVADNLFKAIGFTYFGPFDGHDLPELLRVLECAKQVSGPVLVHVYTTKGKGFSPAEGDPVGYHAISKLPKRIDTNNGQVISLPEQSTKNPKILAKPKKKYSQVFGEFICDKAAVDSDLIAITPAMEEGSGMTEFARQYPKQFFDVAIAEQHAVTLAGGMATQGVKPIVAIYSTFLQRGYDQLIHDVALQNLDVMFAIDRAGLVGEDGATHAGVFDLAYMRCIPNMVLATPKDENECYQLLNTCYEYEGVTAVRYPRGKGSGAEIIKPTQTYPVGKAVIEAVYHTAIASNNVVSGSSLVAGSASNNATSNNATFNSATLNKPLTNDLITVNSNLVDRQQPVRIALLAFGTMVITADAAAAQLTQNQTPHNHDLGASNGTVQNQHPLEITVVNMRWVKPLDTVLIDDLIAKGYTALVTLEEHAVMGGAGSAVNEYVLNVHAKANLSVKNIGIPDRFIEHGSHEEQLADCQLDVTGVVTQIQDLIKLKTQ